MELIQSANSTLNLTALDNQAEGDKGSLVSATNRLVLNVTNVNNKIQKLNKILLPKVFKQLI